MKTPLLTLAAVAALSAGPVWAEGCDPGKAEPLAELEAVNASFMSGDYVAVRQAILSIGGFDIGTLADQLEGAYPDGFDACLTLLQRRDVGGMVQSVAAFHGPGKTLYVYWMTAFEGDGLSILQMSLMNDLDELLASVK